MIISLRSTRLRAPATPATPSAGLFPRQMPKDKGPELKKFMGKRITVKLNGNRAVLGRLTGFDVFMNLTLEEAEETVSATESRPIGIMVIRGNSVVEIGTLDTL